MNPMKRRKILIDVAELIVINDTLRHFGQLDLADRLMERFYDADPSTDGPEVEILRMDG